MTVTHPMALTAHERRWRTLGLLAVAQFMLILDITVVTVAMPDLGADLGMGRASLTWGFVMLFPLLWSSRLSEGAVVTLGHVLMLVFMLVAMLCRRAEYAAPCAP